ncbi:MAG: type II secretion system protein [Calditrichaeota bacterium]|nr:type II secretion system protein [Calditrichota bacterium]
MTLNWQQQRGATLLELIVLITLLGVALPSLLMVMSRTVATHTRTEIQRQAESHAQERIEEILAFKQAHPDWYTTIDRFAGEERLAGGYRRQTTVEYILAWGEANVPLWRVTVTVRYQKLGTVARLTVYLTRYQS